MTIEEDRRYRQLVIWLAWMFAIMIPIMFFFSRARHHHQKDCSAAGGIVVRTYEGLTCITAMQLRLKE